MKKRLSLILMVALLMAFGCASAESMTVNDPKKLDAEAFSMVFQVTIDAQSNSVALTTDEPLTDVVLEYGMMDNEAVNFTPDYVVFSAKEFLPEHMVIVNTFFGDTLPMLRLTYTQGGEEFAYYLVQSGLESEFPIFMLPVDELL